MKKKCILSLFTLILVSLSAAAQTVSPKAIYTDSLGVTNEVTSITDAQAPLEVTFKANPSGLGSNTASYEWHFRRETGTNKLEEMFVRYEEDTQYTFNESGTYSVLLKATLDDGSEIDPDSIKITISDSWLEFPNAFTPNGDGLNDTYHAKAGYRSIISFKATIINRGDRSSSAGTTLQRDGTENIAARTARRVCILSSSRPVAPMARSIISEKTSIC